MALISDYDGIKPSIITYQPYQQTVDTISTLILLYPLFEEVFTKDGLEIHFYKKSLWSKKQKGFLKLEYLPGVHTDTTIKLDESGNPYPPYVDLLFGMAYWSEDVSANWTEQSRILSISSPPKQILSYGLLIENIKVAKRAILQLKLEKMDESGSPLMWDSASMAQMQYHSNNMELLDKVKSKFDFFNKFLQLSEYQPSN